MISLTIDDQKISVEPGTTILQACRQLNIEIPVFCYHDRLSIAGNCRMCLVEVEKSPKPVASCAMPASEGMVVHTQSKQTHKARQGNLEFLLINHPLDCPICDQGGECDLQDITINYGAGKSRFDLNKRAVTDKYMGPLVKTVMTRCIHCTRCIRFAQEIGGIDEIGIVGRGEHAEITSYLEQSLQSELSGNVIDLCPVGALTSKPYAFHGRPWELKHTNSIGVHDAMGSHIRLDHAHQQIMRVVPRACESINQEWLDDRTRFSYDGLTLQRLDKPYVRVNGKLKEASWKQAFGRISEALHKQKSSQVAAIAGDLADVESMFLLKKLMENIGSKSYDCRPLGVKLPYSFNGHFLTNTRISGFDHVDTLLIINSYVREEAPLLNARIGQRVRSGQLTVGYIGPKVDLTYEYIHLGDTPDALTNLDSAFAKRMAQAQHPALILGLEALKRRDGDAIFEKAQTIAHTYKVIRPDWNGFNIIHQHASTVGGMAIGFAHEGGGI